MQHNLLPEHGAQHTLSECNNLSLLTYNVWTGNSLENMDKLCDLITSSNADIICLQEVTDIFYNKLVSSNGKIKSEYDFLVPPISKFWETSYKITNYNYSHYDGELLFIKKKHNADLYSHVRMPGTRQNRHFAYGVLEMNGIRIGIGTAHIESVFYNQAATKIKAEQIRMSCETLDNMNVDCYIIAGDINLTGGAELQAENECIAGLQLDDIWKQLNQTTDDDADEKFQVHDVTWDGARNNNIRDKSEFQRPDRIYFRFFKPTVSPISISRIETNLSDHYGLQAVFKV